MILFVVSGWALWYKLGMPRKARIDAPGALHHIIARGIENSVIFKDDDDRDDFLERLGTLIAGSRTRCLAWALMPNHFHLLLKTGNLPVSDLMRRLLTGYVVRFNRRHHRRGHLFQNRFKSILCQEDLYLKELVRYIHLNPLRAGVVETFEALDTHRYAGHSGLLGNVDVPWQATEPILALFGERSLRARRHYRAFVAAGMDMGKRPELVGGGLVRSAGGWQELKSLRRMDTHLKGDERILGDTRFVEEVLAVARESLDRRQRLAAAGLDFDALLRCVADHFDLPPDLILLPTKIRPRVRARDVLCYWAVRDLKMRTTDLAALLGIGQPAVSRSVARGEAVCLQEGLQVEKLCIKS